ncbi:MAG: beta-lactamase family protein [Bacteroidetes bacterium]|nr:beta-lactamase family protein [Bacteroidota bacterium]
MKIIIRSIIIVIIVSFLVLIFWTLAGCRSISGDLENAAMISQQEPIEVLIDTIQKEMTEKKITGLSIAVSDSTGTVWTKGFGLSNKKSGTEFTETTISNVGSVSKLVTAAAVMRLVEMGLLDLDEPVTTYIPEFKPLGMDTIGNPITVRMLLNHESGLESDAFHDFFLGYEAPEDFPYSYRRAIDAVNQSGVVRKPYEMFSYCNLGYSLLGVIVERAQGAGFQESVKKLVFDPLGMDDSSFNRDEIPSDRMAMGYLAGKPEMVPYIRDMPAGSLNTTAIDMGIFLQSMLASYNSGEGLLLPETVNEMFQPSNEDVPFDLDFQVGLTWWVVDLQNLPGEFIVGHGGDLPPYHSLVIVLPKRDISVFVMVNSVEGVGSFSLTEIVMETVRTFLDLEGQPAIPVSPEKSPIVEIPAALKANLPGYYASPVGLSEIKISGNKLKIYTFNKWFDVYYHENDTLTLGIKLLGLIPIKMPVFDEISISMEDIDGDPAINLRIQDILISPAVKIEPQPIDPSWLSRIGRYESLQSEVMPQYTDFKIDKDKNSGFLCLYLKSNGEWSKFPLQTIDSDSATLMGIGRGLGGSIRVMREAAGETLSFQNFKLRKL